MKWRVLGALVLILIMAQTTTGIGHVPPKVYHFIPVATPHIDIPSTASIIIDPVTSTPIPPDRPNPKVVNSPLIKNLTTPAPIVHTVIKGAWVYDPETSFYGPGLFGGGLACGGVLTTATLGVAHKTLPCGTKVAFMWKGKSIIVTVIDRGPYVAGRQWDLTSATCLAVAHCFTGPIYYKLV